MSRSTFDTRTSQTGLAGGDAVFASGTLFAWYWRFS
jgi:hypothetical protein